jgi:hypothetical protein
MSKLRLLAGAMAVVASFVVVSSASATITMVQPLSSSTYINNVFVSWSATKEPLSVKMVWEYESGPYASYYKAGEKVEATLALTSGEKSGKKGSFTFNPKEPSSLAAHFTSITGGGGELKDGTWRTHVSMVEVGTEVTVVSATVTKVTISTETIPPLLTSPAANSSTGSSTVPVEFSLRSTPTLSAGGTKLSFENEATHAKTTLNLKSSVTAGPLTLNVEHLVATGSIESVEGGESLSEGKYKVELTYSDDYNHAAASVTESGWTLKLAAVPPTISSATGGTGGRPIEITYSLPEAATSNGVSLILRGPENLTLTLGDTTAGTHTVVLYPEDLALSSDILLVSPYVTSLAYGSYTAQIAYQNVLADPQASSEQASFALTSHAPEEKPQTTLTGGSSTPVTSSTTGTSATASTAQVLPLKIERVTATRGKGHIALQLWAPGAGGVEVAVTTGTASHRVRVARVVRAAVAGGNSTLQVIPSRAGARLLERALRKQKALSMRVSVTFTPSHGAAQTQATTVSVRRAAHAATRRRP